MTRGPGAGASPRSPFVGPTPLREEDSFHGRDAEVQELADLLIGRRIVLLYSPSGAGKTSLVTAGLLPFLRKTRGNRLRASPVLRVNHVSRDVDPATPGFNRYVLSLLRGFEECRPAPDRLADSDLVGMTLAAYLRTRWDQEPRTPGSARRFDLLIFDQFEEAFTLDPVDREAKHELFRQIGEAIGKSRETEDGPDEAEAPTRWALFSMREDHIAELDEYRDLVPTALSSTYRMNLLDRKQAFEAIRESARGRGVEFEEDLVNHLVNDLARVRVSRSDAVAGWSSGNYVEPVQLQVVCMRLWRQLVTPETRFVGLKDLGAGSSANEVDGALASFYDDAVHAAATETGVKERAIRDWFEEELITPGKVRTQLLREPDDLKRSRVPSATVDALANAHVVRVERRAGREWIELTHDRLIQPILDANKSWWEGNPSLLPSQAKLWKRSGEKAGYLLTGKELQDAEAWAGRNDENLDDEVDRKFLAACREARDRAQAIARANERVRASRQRLRLWIGLLVFIVLGLLISVGQGIIKSEDIRRQRSVAQAHETIGDIRVDIEGARLLSSKDVRGAVRRVLAADQRIDQAMEKLNRNLVPSFWQAAAEKCRRAGKFVRWICGLDGSPVDEAGAKATIAKEHVAVDAALLSILRGTPRIETWPGVLPEYRAVALGRDLRTLVTIDRGGRVQVWRRDGGATPLESTFPGGRMIAYDSDGGLLAAADDKGHIAVWRVFPDRLEQVAMLNQRREMRPPVTALAVGAGARVASAGRDKSVVLWDLVSGSPRRLPGVGDSATYALAFDREGKRLASADWAGSVGFWDGLGGTTPVRRPLEGAAISGDVVAAYSIAFDASGTRLAVGAHDGSVLMWRLAGAEKVGPVRLRGGGGHDSRPVNSLAFAADGESLASADAGGAVILWNAQAAASWESGRPLPIRRRIGGLGESIRAIALEGGEVIAAGDRSVLVMDVGGPRSALASALPGSCSVGGKDAARLAGHWSQVALAPASGQVFAACGNTVRAWRLPPGSDSPVGREIGIEVPRLDTFLVDAWGKTVVTASAQGRLTAWQRGEGATPARVEILGPGRAASALALDQTGKWLAASVADQFHLWNLSSDPPGHATEPIAGAGGYLALAFSPEPTRLAAGGEDPVPKVWSLRGGRMAPEVSPNDGSASREGRVRMTELEFDPDGKLLYSADSSGIVTAWDAGREGGGIVRKPGRAAIGVSTSVSGERARAYDVDAGGRVRVQLAWTADRLHTAEKGHVDERLILTLIDDGKLHRIASDGRGNRLVVTDDAVTVWDLGPEALREAAGRIAKAGVSTADGQ